MFKTLRRKKYYSYFFSYLYSTEDKSYGISNCMIECTRAIASNSDILVVEERIKKDFSREKIGKVKIFSFNLLQVNKKSGAAL